MSAAILFGVVTAAVVISSQMTSADQTIDFAKIGHLTHRGFTSYIGRAPSGATFEIDTPNRASIGAMKGSGLGGGLWFIRCATDEMTDSRQCEIENGDSQVRLILKNASADPILCIVGHDFPGGYGLFRIGSGVPSATTSGCFDERRSRQLISQFRPGVTIKTRRFQWPYQDARDSNYTLGPDYLDAVQLLKFMYANRASHLGLVSY